MRFREWTLHIARLRFWDVFRRARLEGPQYVRPRNGQGVYVVAAEDWDYVRRKAGLSPGLVEFFRRSPFVGSGVDLQRRRDYPRKVDFG